jgi:hypothetical protein
METFLREVVIVGQNFREAFTAHGLHRNAIGKTVFLVGTGLLERQGIKERSPRLRKHGPFRILQRVPHHVTSPLPDTCS